MLLRVGRACYSTGVTQEFLQNILARAQEATAKKSDAVAKPARKRRNNNNKRNNRHSKPISPRVKPASSPNVINKQPQFKRKNGIAVESRPDGVDLIDVMSGSKPNPAKKPAFKKSKEIPGLTRNTMVKGEGKHFVPKLMAQKEYIPQEPTPLSLMKFHPEIPVTPAARMINYSLDALRSANYPLNRFPNYGFRDSDQGPPKHITISLQTPTFGKYQPDHGLVFEREKFLSELEIQCDLSKVDAEVSGKYQVLKQYTEADFGSITKSDKKRKELVANSEVARKSLESNPLDPALKELVHDVCSGLKPISDLTQ